MRSVQRSLVALFLALPAVVVAQDKNQATRVATCVGGLREYARPEDVPTPHDTVYARVNSSQQVGGMTRITNRDDFRAALLSAAASEGATGYISYAPGSQDAGGMQSLGRILPVYVPSDTTRIRTACKK